MGYYGIFNHFSIKKLIFKTRWSISRILYLKKAATINLVLMLPLISSVLPYLNAEPRSSYLTGFLDLLPKGFTKPFLLPKMWWALTSPFHPYLNWGGLFSVALSLRFPSPGITRLWCSDESGLSSLKGSRTTI